MKNIRLLLFVAYFIVPGTFFANDIEDAEEVIVIASRIPTLASDVIGSVESISSAELEAQMANGLEQIVRYIPGVSASNESQYGRSLTEDVHIRGIRGGAIFLIDGIRISDSYTGYGRDTVDVDLLKKFITDRGKILPRRLTGLTAKQQRDLTTAIKRARIVALLPFVNPEG